MIDVFIGVVCLAVGYLYRDLRDSIKDLKSRLNTPKPDVGVTPASYGPKFNKDNQDGDVGLVSPKTPQQLEWQEQEELREMQHNVRVKPR